jgi:uncharacterized surface protein with fasciclin (FAS1) repeats
MSWFSMHSRTIVSSNFWLECCSQVKAIISKTPTIMKLSSFSKITAASLLTALSIVTLPNVTQAQTDNVTYAIEQFRQFDPEQRRLDDLEQSKICDRVWQESSNYQFEGRPSFDDFLGVNLTNAQKQAYEALDAQAEAKRAELYKQTVSIADPSAILAFLSRFPETVPTPPDVQSAIQAELDRNPKMDQLDALNQQFDNGKYGLFVGSYITYLTPEQQTQLAQISTDFYSQVQALMTPAQQPQYSKNLAARLRINAACDAMQPVSSYPALGRIIEVSDASNTQTAQPQTIVEIAAGNPNFSTLVTAVKAAGLAETLSGDGPFTVFAPTNEAFAALPEGTLENLLKPENRELLRKVLTYHVVPGDVMAEDLRSGRVATVEGNNVRVRVRRKGVRVNNARVVTADIDAKNGVIHVIDRVLLPPDL